MKLDSPLNINALRGDFKLQLVRADNKQVIEEYNEHNIIVLDSRKALIVAISKPTFNSTINKIKIGQDIGETMQGSQTITFNDANPDTIVRSAGSFVNDGFQVGDEITVAGSVYNNGSFGPVAAVTDTTLTMDASVALTAESGTAGVSITRGTLDAPSDPLDTYNQTTMDVVFDAPYTLGVGYADPLSATFNVTIKGADVMADYPNDTSKIITSAALHTGDGNVFAYKRFPQKSISALVDLNISWTIHY